MNNARLGLALGATLASTLPGAPSVASPAEEAALRTAFDGVAMSDAVMAEERGGTAGRGVIANQSSAGVVTVRDVSMAADSYSGGAITIVNSGAVVVTTPGAPINDPPPIAVSQHHAPRYDIPMQTPGFGGDGTRRDR